MSRLLFVNLPVADLDAFRADSREAVDAFADDLDGHHWEVMWMSREAVEAGPADVAAQPA